MYPDGDYGNTVPDDQISHFLSDAEHITWRKAMAVLFRVYGKTPGIDFTTIESEVSRRVRAARNARSEDLNGLDRSRASDLKWFARPGRPAYCAYVDRFAGDLSGCVQKIPYLQQLEVGLFHPLPLLRCRDGDSDGGFAVSDYRDVDPGLGTFEDLVTLATELRKADISLVLDVVCNHTAKEHAWARGFAAGDPKYKDFYIRLHDEAQVEDWSRALHQVFPETAPGNFTFDDEAGGWIWTTFYPFQWDLNYNPPPNVFIEMLDVLFFLANAGAEGFRLDSATYLWKVKGTACKNLPETHDLILAMKTLMSLVAPSVFFLAEAIEDINEVIPFFGASSDAQECDVAYNNTPMTALWGSLAEGRSQIFDAGLIQAAQRPAHSVWLNYARCHDDIIWSAMSALATTSRQKAWSRFYTGAENSFAQGMAFQAPPGMARSTCGMAASLCGVGQYPAGIARLRSVYSLVFALDGLPMIYMGDELAMTNDLSFLDDPARAQEFRWLHRPEMDWSKAGRVTIADTNEHLMFSHIRMLCRILQTYPDINCAGPALPITTPESVIGFARPLNDAHFICLANLSGATTKVDVEGAALDLFDGKDVTGSIRLDPWQSTWLMRR